MAPFGLKLWENAFQTIPDISFFDVEKKQLAKIFDPPLCSPPLPPRKSNMTEVFGFSGEGKERGGEA